MTRKHIVNPDQAEELVHKLYQQAATEEPSKDLDDAILSQAKAAADSTASRSQSRKNPLQVWQRFGSLAATFVVVVTIGLIYQDNREQLAPEAPLQLTTEAEVASQPGPMASSPVADDVSESSEPQKAMVRQVPAVEAAPTGARLSVAPDEQLDAMSAEPDTDSKKVSPQAAKEQTVTPEASYFKPVMKRMMSAPPTDGFESGVAKVRALLAADEVEQARAHWLALQADYPDRTLPADLVEFFAGDNQVGEAE